MLSQKTQANSLWTNKAGIAAHLGCCQRHIGNLMRSRKLPFYKLGRIVRFNIPECEKALKAFEVKSVAAQSSVNNAPQGIL